jgi:hypothetical protein
VKALRDQAKIKILIPLEDSPSDDRGWVPPK